MGHITDVYYLFLEQNVADFFHELYCLLKSSIVVPFFAGVAAELYPREIYFH